MVKLCNIVDYWAQLAQRPVALSDCHGYRGKSLVRFAMWRVKSSKWRIKAIPPFSASEMEEAESGKSTIKATRRTASLPRPAENRHSQQLRVSSTVCVRMRKVLETQKKFEKLIVIDTASYQA
jgi:hypothetical protein